MLHRSTSHGEGLLATGNAALDRIQHRMHKNHTGKINHNNNNNNNDSSKSINSNGHDDGPDSYNPHNHNKNGLSHSNGNGDTVKESIGVRLTDCERGQTGGLWYSSR